MILSGVCIVMRLLNRVFRPASTNEKRTTHLDHILYVAAYGEKNKVVNDYTNALYSVFGNVYYTRFVYLIIDVIVTFKTPTCGISNTSTEFIHWRHYQPTCSEIFEFFYISLYASCNWYFILFIISWYYFIS